MCSPCCLLSWSDEGFVACQGDSPDCSVSMSMDVEGACLCRSSNGQGHREDGCPCHQFPGPSRPATAPAERSRCCTPPRCRATAIVLKASDRLCRAHIHPSFLAC